MDTAVFGIPLWVELEAARFGGLQGALFAAGVRERRVDVTGVIGVTALLRLAVRFGRRFPEQRALPWPWRSRTRMHGAGG